jgi:hypothetical protein
MMILLLTIASAFAAQVGGQVFVPRPLLAHPVFALRIGAGADLLLGDGTGVRTTLCGEVSPIDRLSLEGCGNGAGFLHHADVPDIAHFRVRVDALRTTGKRREGALVAGAGFTEVQRGADALGFRFGPAREAHPVEAAGPEVSLGFRGRHWVHAGAYLVADLTWTAAHVPAAPAVYSKGSPTLLFGALTAGLGF